MYVNFTIRASDWVLEAIKADARRAMEEIASHPQVKPGCTVQCVLDMHQDGTLWYLLKAEVQSHGD